MKVKIKCPKLECPFNTNGHNCWLAKYILGKDIVCAWGMDEKISKECPLRQDDIIRFELNEQD